MQRQKRWYWISYILVFCSVIVFLPGCNSNSPEQVTIDASKSYAFEGWGTSLAWWANEIGGWPDGQRNDIINRLFGPPPTGLGLNVVRYNIGAGDSQPKQGFTCPSLRLGGEVPTFEKSAGSWNWDADANQRTILQAAKAAIEQSAKPFVAEAFANSPPAWMTESGCTSGNNPKQECDVSFLFININCKDVGENISEAYYDKYADYLSKVVQYFNASLGIPFRTVEPFNESNPQDGGFNWPNGCTSQCQEGANFLPQTQNTIIALLCRKLAGTATTVSAPDENSIDTTIATYKNYDDTTKACISQVNTHSYQGDKRDELCKLVLGDVQGHCMQTSNKRLWMSEYGPYNSKDQSDFGLALTQSLQITQDMNEIHPSSWVYWQPVEASEYGNNYGLLRAPFCSPHNRTIDDHTIADLNSGNDKCKNTHQTPYNISTMKQYYAMANYSWFIKPGDLILNVDEGKHTLAAFNPHLHTLTIVATNGDTKDHPVTYNLEHFTSVTGSVSPYTTSADNNANYKNSPLTIPISGTQFTVSVPKQSITTYVIHNISELSSGNPGTTTENPLGKVDWTKAVTETDLGCNGPTGPHLGVQVDEKQFADVTGDGKKEAFVAVACVASTSSWPDRLEVFDGASDPAHPRLMATLLDYKDGTDERGLRIGSTVGIPHSITISGQTATVVSLGYAPTDPNCCPSRQITDTFTWNGSGFTRGPRSVVQAKAP
jgi:O-glycosyl hydrolase